MGGHISVLSGGSISSITISGDYTISSGGYWYSALGGFLSVLNQGYVTELVMKGGVTYISSGGLI